jgi:hypothetical protein
MDVLHVEYQAPYLDNLVTVGINKANGGWFPSKPMVVGNMLKWLNLLADCLVEVKLPWMQLHLPF